MAKLEEVFVVNNELRVRISGLDLNPDMDPNVTREFILFGAGLEPKTNKPLIKLEYEKNPNGSGVLFVYCTKEDLDRIKNARKEMRARGTVGNYDEGAKLKETRPIKLRGHNPDFNVFNPSYTLRKDQINDLVSRHVMNKNLRRQGKPPVEGCCGPDNTETVTTVAPGSEKNHRKASIK
jgi:hypothetical protein